MSRAVPRNRLGMGDPCPFCGSTGGVSESDTGEYVCLMCGEPRVVVEGGSNRAFGEKRHLLRSKTLKLKQAAWSVAGGITAASSIGIGFLAAAVAFFVDYSPGWLAFVLTATALPLVASVVSFSRAKRARLDSAAALEKAQAIVAQEVLRVGGPQVDAVELARKLRVSVPRAEELLALAQVENFLTEPMPAVPDQRVRVTSESSEGAKGLPQEDDALTDETADKNALRGRQRTP